MTKELKQKIDKIVRDYCTSPKALTLYRNLKGLAYDVAEESTKELQEQIEKMKAELHHRLVSPSHDDSDCLDKIVGLDRLWQFGQEF